MPRNEGHDYTVQVALGCADLASWLAQAFAHSPVEVWADRITGGEVTVDGRLPDGPVPRGAVVVWRRPPWDEPEVPVDWQVLHEDADVVAVHKPAGLPTMPAGGFLMQTLLTQVQASFPEATPMHRLGRGTSGVVLFARSDRARSALQRAWRDGRVDKTYAALVEGGWEGERLVTAPIGPVAHPRLGSLHAATPDGRPSRSWFRPLRRRDEATVVEVRIDTGRPHQIRIHAAWAGHPLVGDPLYGVGGIPRSDALPGDLGYVLHAWRLRIPHPAGGDLELVDPLPSSLT